MSGGIEQAVATIMAARYQPRVGDRVRVLPSECDYCKYTQTDEVGRVGTVVESDHGDHDCVWERCAEEADGAEPFHAHHVWVKFDGGPVGDPFDDHFAPSELELLEPATAAEGGATRQGEA